jgi:uncharacterized protein YlxW (UPF0749 family)
VKRWIVPVTTVSLIIGGLLSVQYKSQATARHAGPSRRVEDLVFMLKATEKSNQQLSEQVTSLQERLSKMQLGDGPEATQLQPTYEALEGPGLLVTITESGAENKMEDGTSAVVHAEDLLKIVNELRSGGAEAVALNGHRLTETSEVITAGQHIMVNKQPIVAPYALIALGPADEMKNQLALRGGVVDYLQFYGIEVKAQPKKRLEVPALGEAKQYRFAKPAPPSEETQAAAP